MALNPLLEPVSRPRPDAKAKVYLMTKLVPILRVGDLRTNPAAVLTKRQFLSPLKEEELRFHRYPAAENLLVLGINEFWKRRRRPSRSIAVDSSAQRRFRSDNHLKRAHLKN